MASEAKNEETFGEVFGWLSQDLPHYEVAGNWRVAGEVVGSIFGKFTKGIVFGFGFAVGLAIARAAGII